MTRRKYPNSIHRAAYVAALYILDQRGLLDDLTYQDIADLLSLGHRSTAMRYMRDLETVKHLANEIGAKIEQP